jgi:WD40 repeat protein
LLATAGEFQAHVWDVERGEKLRTFTGRDFAVFSPDGRTIAIGSDNLRDVNLFDSESGTKVVTMDAAWARSASFSLDGSKLATGGFDGACKVWGSATGALLRTIEVGAGVRSVSWGRGWVRDTQRAMAFAMGHHPRLGAGAQVLELEVGVLRMILDLA